jgi:iron complex outermembrane recepter protein
MAGTYPMKTTSIIRARLLGSSALVVLALAGAAQAAAAAGTATTDDSAAVSEVVVTMARETRSSVEMPTTEIQKVLPGVSPLKAIQTLPGVLYETADPWGNNEQNESLFVHGFATQQLGYTMDGVPLGDQQYGNYNGLSPSRAVSSENVARVNLSSGAGALGVASTSNLGGAIETYSRDPSATREINVRETVGSYETTRTFGRFDSGDLGNGNSFYASYLHHDAKAWDFNGHQRDDQANVKFVHDDAMGKLTAFIDWQSKFEPNEDATSFGNQQTTTAANFTPYTRPFYYPNIAACTSSLTGGPGSPPPAQGNNFSNCFSAAQRADVLAYLKYDLKISDHVTWSNQAYYHYDYGRGIVAGPINQAGLPGLFATYFPALVAGGSSTSTGTLTNISNLFGGSGNEVRTTEYRINRGGLISTAKGEFGDHQLEAGVWVEHNESAQHRVWYPFSSANNDLSPYDVPNGQSIFTQYYAQFFVTDVQMHIQDSWKILPNLTLQIGDKASLQDAKGSFPINQQNLPGVAVPVHYPTGKITSDEYFLPQIGALWDATDHEQVFFNAQKNLRQFIPYGAGSNFYGFSPWSLGTQAAFDLFKSTVKPETSITYELGARTKRDLDAGVLTSIEGQASVYHVNFSNRLLNIAPYSFINPGPAILANVGGVTTNGVDIAGTANFGEHFHLYDAISYNKSTYDSDYQSGTTLVNGVTTPVTVATGGKWVPLTPDWLNKTIASLSFGSFEAQLSGDYVGRRYVTYLNDLQVKSTFLLGLEASYRFDPPAMPWLKGSKLSLNVTNIGNVKGVSTAVVTSNSGGYQAYPIAPTMVFVTFETSF